MYLQGSFKRKARGFKAEEGGGMMEIEVTLMNFEYRGRSHQPWRIGSLLKLEKMRKEILP